jgi:hypothetical protein
VTIRAEHMSSPAAVKDDGQVLYCHCWNMAAVCNGSIAFDRSRALRYVAGIS